MERSKIVNRKISRIYLVVAVSRTKKLTKNYMLS
jgi:hypothetical protein